MPIQASGKELQASHKLIVTIHSRGAEPPKDFHGLLGAVGVGPDQDKFAIVIERHGVGLDRLGGHVKVGKMGPKCLDN